MDEPRKGRAKSKKLRVRFPDGVEYCYSSSKETFIKTLRKIGGAKLSRVKLEVCHLPMFSKEVYERYQDFMEPIGDGWYVNTQGDSYTKFMQLKVINEQLNLGLMIDLSEDFVGKRVARGAKGMCVFEVTFPDHTVIGEENTGETFMQCIWHLGIDDVRRLHLQHSGKELITSYKMYKEQVQVDVDRWLVVPPSLKDKVKILRVISVMLHIKMDITYFSTTERKVYKKIGKNISHKIVNRKENYEDTHLKELTDDNRKKVDKAKFHKGDIVFHSFYGEGEIIKHIDGTKSYQVQFYERFKDLSIKYQIHYAQEDDLIMTLKGSYPCTKQKVLTTRKNNSVLLNNSKDNYKLLKQQQKFNIGDHVYNEKYGIGVITAYYKYSKTYDVMFEEYFKDHPDNKKVINFKEKKIKLV